MKRSMIDVEYDINNIMYEVTGMYGLQSNWYGDNYLSMLEDRYGNDLRNEAFLAKTDEEYQDCMDQIRENFECNAHNFEHV